MSTNLNIDYRFYGRLGRPDNLTIPI